MVNKVKKNTSIIRDKITKILIKSAKLNKKQVSRIWGGGDLKRER